MNKELIITDFILVIVLLLNLRILASSRLGAVIRTAALQGALIGLMPLIAHNNKVSSIWEPLILSIAIIALKGIVFPKLLFKAIQRAEVSREISPIVGYVTSLMIGLALCAVSFWTASRLPSLPETVSNMLVPAALFSILSGLFLLVSRKLALSQVVGFIILENGVFLFGAGVNSEISVLLEAGILLDIFVAVFVMGIMIFHISKEFDHIDAEKLSSLKDN